MQTDEFRVKTINWVNILFFAFTTIFAFAAPFYFYQHGFSRSLLFLSLFFGAASGMAITVGYHRLFAHVTYRAHPILQFILLFFGAAAFEQSALKWASQHRNHHLYVDTERDPYSIKAGFWYAHVGWLIFWKHKNDFSNVKDLQKNRMLMHQHQFYGLWAVTAGILVPVLAGFWMGEPVGAFLMAVCCRITLVYHATFCINSVCHMFGSAPYDPTTSARDHWFVALLTFGEGYHNFHHRFPSDYRNGIRWYHWDPSKWTINAFSFLRLAYDLKRISYFRILHARLAVESATAVGSSRAAQIRDAVLAHSKLLRARLVAFEAATGEYQTALKRSMSERSDVLKKLNEAALEKMRQRKAEFQSSYQRWTEALKARRAFPLQVEAGNIA